MESDERGDAPPSPDPSQQELAILALLSEGLKDDVVAKRLGLAKRTYRRRLDTLLDKLGATSRFQAGALAVHRGWVRFGQPGDQAAGDAVKRPVAEGNQDIG